MREPRHEVTPRREDHRQLTRSRTDRQLAGVCAGIAEYTNLPAWSVRLLTVVVALWATPFPVILAYVVASQALPEADGEAPNPLAVDWQANSMRVTWKGATTPYVVPWRWVVGGYAGATALALFGGLMTMLGVSGATAFHALLPTLLIPLGIVGLIFLLVPRTWALTLSESALWIERPGTRAERIDLRDVEGFHPSSHPFTIHLRDGTLIELAPPPGGPELDVVIDELRRSLARLEDHDATLEATKGERSRLLGVARAARTKHEPPA